MTGIVGDPTNWKILRSLEPEFVRTLRLCCLFGEEGTEALLVDDEDEVWAFGPNKFGRLGIGLSLPIPGPVKVFALCGRTVSSFAYGEQHVIALTKTGLVFGWGNNERQQVVPGGFRIIYTPTVVYDEADPAVEIACGKSHSACRTREGAVYYWGNDRRRTKVGSARKYIQISCLESSTLAVCQNGEVHKLDPLNGWNIITSRGTIIRKIAGGKRHALAVSADGQLYVWGANSEHQLGLDHSNNVLEAVCHSSLMNTYGRIVDIAVSKYDNVSAVTTERSEVLFWGHSPGPRTPSPIKVPYESMQDVFATISRVPATPVALIMPTRFSEKLNSLNEASSHVPRWESSFLKAIAELFDNPDSSDVKFRVGAHTIHAHKVVLKIQSEYFREMLEGPWEEDQSNTIEVKTSSYAPYRAFLRYFYTGEVELPAEDMPELLNLANSCCEDQLKILCEKRFESTISIDNCASLYSTALRCRATDLQNFCLKFAAKNLPAVSRTSAHEALTDEVARKFLEGAAKAMDS